MPMRWPARCEEKKKIIGRNLCLTPRLRGSRPTRDGRMIEKRTLWAMAVACGLAVANIN